MIKQKKIKYPASAKQIQVFHAILVNNGIMDTKEDMVWNATNHRTQRVSEMSYVEMKELLEKLQGQSSKDKAQSPKDKADIMRKKILHYCHLMNWNNGDALDWNRINGWCKEYGHAHKLLNDYKLEELPMLVSQFEQVYRHFGKTKI